MGAAPNAAAHDICYGIRGAQHRLGPQLSDPCLVFRNWCFSAHNVGCDQIVYESVRGVHVLARAWLTASPSGIITSNICVAGLSRCSSRTLRAKRQAELHRETHRNAALDFVQLQLREVLYCRPVFDNAKVLRQGRGI